MRILFCVALPYLPVTINGAGRSMDALARRFQEKGHEILLLTLADSAASISGLSGLMQPLLYPAFRSAQIVEDLPAILSTWQPDIALVRAAPEAGKIVNLLVEKNTPCLFLVSSFSSQPHYGYYESPKIQHVAQCRFVATALKRWYNVDATIIPPLIEPDAYKTDASGGAAVLFINPSLEKGIYFVLALARLLPQRRFIIGESWPIPNDWRAYIKGLASSNVTWESPCEDLRPLYRQARLLLVPSLWEEAWGRVASEAQISGIPVLATKRGGLAETVGAGGLVFDPAADASVWATAIESLFKDSGYYKTLSDAALFHARREALQPATIMAQWELLLRANRLLVKPA